MKILPLAKIAAARKRQIEQTKEMKMPIDVEALYKQSGSVVELVRLIIEQCAKACIELSAQDGVADAMPYVKCAAAIRALKP